MINFEIQGKDYKLMDEFHEVKVSEIALAYSFLKEQPMGIINWLVKGSDVEEELKLRFKIDWVAFFSDIPKDLLMLVPIDFLYNQCEKFTRQPEVFIDLKKFKIGGNNYKLMEPLTTISGAKMLFGEGNFRQWTIGNQLTKMIADSKAYKTIEPLKQLIAVLYDCDKDIPTEKKLKDFDNLTASQLWSAYFFFAMLLERYKKYFLLSTSKSQHQKGKNQLKLEQLKKQLSKTTIGKLLPSKWLKWEYLILEENHL
jgi:hypothetical protein